MITRTNNIRSNNTFGVRINMSATDIHPEVWEKSKGYVLALREAAQRHDELVRSTPEANQNVLRILAIDPRRLPNETPANANQGLCIKAILEGRKQQNIPSNPDLWTMTSVSPKEVIKNLSDYWDNLTGFSLKLGQD